MKALILIAILALTAVGAYAFDFGGLFSGCGKPAALKDLVRAQPQPAAATPAVVKPPEEYPMNIKPSEVSAFISAKKPVVIDVRTPAEYAAGRLAAVNLHLDFYAPDFKDQLAKLDKSAAYLLYCRSGNRSGQALNLMRQMGFTDIRHVEGGIIAWTAAGLPVVK